MLRGFGVLVLVGFLGLFLFGFVPVVFVVGLLSLLVDFFILFVRLVLLVDHGQRGRLLQFGLHGRRLVLLLGLVFIPLGHDLVAILGRPRLRLLAAHFRPLLGRDLHLAGLRAVVLADDAVLGHEVD